MNDDEVNLQDGSADSYDHKAPAPGGPSDRSEVWLLRAGLFVAAIGLLGSLMAGGVACEPKVYNPKAVDWQALGADLDQLVSTCHCAPILVRLSWQRAEWGSNAGL